MAQRKLQNSNEAAIGSKDLRDDIALYLGEGPIRKKVICAGDGRETIQKFQWDLRRSLKTSRRRNKSSTINPKYGRWMPRNRYNVDQIPLPFVNEQDKTYETLGATQV